MLPFPRRSASTINTPSSFASRLARHLLHSNPFSSTSFPNLSTLLQGRISCSHVLQIHAQVCRRNAHQDNLIATRLIGHYPSHRALAVFSHLESPNIFPFNAIIRVLAEAGLVSNSFLLFKKLKQSSLSPNDFTFSFLLKACLRSGYARWVKQVHVQIVKLGYLGHSAVCNSLLVAYSKVDEELDSARKVFDEIPEKDFVPCWTSLIAGYAQAGRAGEVLQLFCKMVEENLSPEDDTMVSVLSACSTLDMVQFERWVRVMHEVFLENFDSDKLVRGSINTVLVYLYGKLGKVEKSREIFDEIDNIGKGSVLPWNAMIGTYVQNGCPVEALNLFRLMVGDSDHRPNHVTMVSVLSACGQVGDLELGMWVHDYLKSRGRRGVLHTNTFLATALIDMYFKCGSLERAREVFNKMKSKDVVAFNAMIMGLAANGEGREANRIFCEMKELGLHPNAGTFLGLLCACNHAGLPDEGRQIFRDMNLSFSISPELEHYACYIDLLARVGLIEEALEVVGSMPFEPNNYVWGALLGGCLLHSRLDLARNIYGRLVEMDPRNSGGYVMLANAFAVDQQWTEVSVLRWVMRQKGVKKQPGQSWITIDGFVHEFLVGSPANPQIEGISTTLSGLMNVMRVPVFK
ncbi:putative pentatricopeptide repeat-containing protein At3g08820 [Carica papaya]|uniref:putative pentatricopeptide repeat-containing protein At3g08820 n=1 Tax=Carica papaya TaxID=3649 RepID=UPI000B8D001F|nr:putative pentatricopeptide repeat-containing protein At3g08820 [Carica papaya]